MESAGKELLKLIPDVKLVIVHDSIISIDFTNNNNPFVSSLRRSSDVVKKRVCELLGEFPNLEHLNLQKSKIGNDFHLCNPSVLTYLNLGSNCLNKVPMFIEESKNLSFLNLGSNYIADVNIHFPSSLTVLKLHKNKVKKFPNLSGLTNLKTLNFYQNKACLIPKDVFEIRTLEFFSWGMVPTKIFPEEVSNWKNLKWLSIIMTQIEKLPDTICDCVNLIGLRLAKNKIKTLPKNIGNLKKLKQLTLYMNELKFLPDSFRELQLDMINLEKNNL